MVFANAPLIGALQNGNEADVVIEDDGLIEGYGEIVMCLSRFAKDISFRLFNIDFTLWDIFIAGLVIGLLAVLWYGLSE